MGLLNSLEFDGENSFNYGVYISGGGTFDAPKRKAQKIEIPGRNGDLIIDDGAFENITVSYPAFIVAKNETEFKEKLEAFRSALLSKVGYVTLSDTYHEDEFRLAAYLEGLEVSPKLHNRTGDFTLVFECKPQRFLKSGQVPVNVESGDTIVNPTEFASKPLIEVNGTGALSVGALTVNITGEASQKIYIDSDIMEAYIDQDGALISADDRITLNGPDFPTLQPGETGITFDGITSVIITPRWWRI